MTSTNTPADTTAARRKLLALLLDRMDRDALLPAERPLLRSLVDAEVTDTARNEVYREDVESSAARAEQAEATLGRVRELAERWRYVAGLKDSPLTSLLHALGDPSTDDANCTSQYHGIPGERWHCALHAGHNGDHVDARDGSCYWNDYAGVYPLSKPPVADVEPVDKA